MGIFNQFNQFKEMHNQLKNMSPDEMQSMMEQAKEAQKQLDDMIEKKVRQIIKEEGLVSKHEVEKMIKN